MRDRRSTLIILGSAMCLLFPARGEESSWARFRGPNGSGVIGDTGSLLDRGELTVAWKTPLPGIGVSSPSILGNRIVLTSANEDGSIRSVICLSLADGSTLWTQDIPFDTHPKHAKNSYATQTAACTDDAVFVLFGSTTQYLAVALDWNGQIRWRKDLGPFESRHGPGASPIVVGNRLIVTQEQEGPSRVVALDVATGEMVWETSRRNELAAYSTPLFLPDDDGGQLIVSSTAGIASLDPNTGGEIWSEACFPDRCVGSPTSDGKIIVASCGGGGRGTVLVALRAERELEPGTDRKIWSLTKTIPYCPTPMIVGDKVMLALDNGVVRAVSAATGENVWTERLLGNVSASPVRAGQAVLFASESGALAAVGTGDEFQIKGRQQIGDEILSTPALAGERLIIRGRENVWCLTPKS